jgi:hypothetical protein
MSTVPLTSADVPAPATEECSVLLDDEMRRLAEQDDCVVERQSAALGIFCGVILGAALWAGCILAGIAMIRR